MINLLPYDMKKQLKAARLNSILLRYTIVLLASIVFLLLIGLGLNMYLQMTKDSIKQQVSQVTDSSMTIAEINTRLTNIQQQVSSVKTIVDSSINYGKILIGLGQALPAGVILDSINLSNTTISKPMELTFYAKTNQAANNLKASLTSSSLLSNVSEPTISNDSNSPFQKYPIKVLLTVTINQGSVK